VPGGNDNYQHLADTTRIVIPRKPQRNSGSHTHLPLPAGTSLNTGMRKPFWLPQGLESQRQAQALGPAVSAGAQEPAQSAANDLSNRKASGIVANPRGLQEIVGLFHFVSTHHPIPETEIQREITTVFEVMQVVMGG